MQKLNATENTFLLHNQQLRCRQTACRVVSAATGSQQREQSHRTFPTFVLPAKCRGKKSAKGIQHPKIQSGKSHSESGEAFLSRGECGSGAFYLLRKPIFAMQADTCVYDRNNYFQSLKSSALEGLNFQSTQHLKGF